jgi:SAM-dependent methyltransferase
VNFQEHYTAPELDVIAARVGTRQGWDFSRMNTTQAATPWEYLSVVREHLRSTDSAIDIGTGGGERLIELRTDARTLLGVDPDADMILRARELALREGAANVEFEVGTGEGIDEHFDVVINRHAPFEPGVIHQLLRPGGYFVTQQVGQNNMANVKLAFQLVSNHVAPITPEMFLQKGFSIERYEEYDLSFTVCDIDSLIFWLQALDMAHSDFNGFDAQRDADAINRLLSTSLTSEGVVTNEHRYLMVAVKNE